MYEHKAKPSEGLILLFISVIKDIYFERTKQSRQGKGIR